MPLPEILLLQELTDTPRELPNVLDALVCARKKRTSSGQRASIFHELQFLTQRTKGEGSGPI